MPDTTIVVPCYNESARLRCDSFVEFSKSEPNVRFIFVNDGSTDQTLALLQDLESRDPDRFQTIDLPQNRGKAEAVRVGMLVAIESGADSAGYWDADLATPLSEVTHFIDALNTRPELEIVFGSRSRLLGREIDRRPIRHYMGRVFATLASLVLDLPAYDTQCGAKLFRINESTHHLFAEPFLTNWVFDVEILARLVRSRHGTNLAAPSDVIYEYPLQTWKDVAGSKVKATDFIRALVELERVHRVYVRSTR